MVNNFHYRFLLVITIITGILFVVSVPEMMKIANWLILGGTFFFLYYITFTSFKKLSKDRIDEILFVDTFKKFGINIDEE